MLQDEALSYIKEQFEEKNMVLSQYGEEVSAWTLYEDVFGDISQTVPVVMIDEDQDKHIVPMSIEDALEQAENRNDILLGGCTYFKNYISKKTAKDIYSFIIDMDNVYSGTLLNALRRHWATATGDILPMPTYIVNSGTGLHLYFVLSEPIPHFRAMAAEIDSLYRALAIQQTTNRVYLKKQVQWFGQDFRVAGGRNKYDWKNTVFRVGEKWDIDDLAKAVGLKDVHFIRYGEERVKRQRKPGTRKKGVGWRSNPAFYHYSVENCRNKTKEGNRYTSMCALSVIAWKCGVPQSVLERDLFSLLPEYNKGAARPIREKEIYSAMKMYNEKAMLTQRESLENWQGWDYQPIKRNGRKRLDHLQAEYWINEKGRPEVNTCKQNRELALKFMRDNGEIKGRPTKEHIVREYREKYPNATKTDIVKNTGLSYDTVRKYWGKEQNNG